MTVWLVAGVGLSILITISIAIGASLDTTAPRHEWKRLAAKRRRRTEKAGTNDQAALCKYCPLRHLR